MDEDKPVIQDGNGEQDEGDKKADAKPSENVKRNTLAAATWVGLAISIADVPNMPPSLALLKVRELLGLDQSKSE